MAVIAKIHPKLTLVSDTQQLKEADPTPRIWPAPADQLTRSDTNSAPPNKNCTESITASKGMA